MWKSFQPGYFYKYKYDVPNDKYPYSTAERISQIKKKVVQYNYLCSVDDIGKTIIYILAKIMFVV